jgi:hypothetical protein
MAWCRLGNNGIGDEGAKAVSGALAGLPHLLTL